MPAPDLSWINDALPAPFLWRGRTPAGWDCWGLVAWGRPQFGLSAPDHADLYGAKPESRVERLALQGRLFASQMAGWRSVDRFPGAVALFRIGGAPVHVGLCLGGDDFLHCLAARRPGEPATRLSRFSDPEWRTRIEGFYDEK